MNTTKCEICGGSFIINTDSGLGICDSCGNTVEIDDKTVAKYRNLMNTAARKMRYNSVQYYTEAIEILEDILFVDGAEEKIELCKKSIGEINSSKALKEKQEKEADSDNTKVGILIVVCIILGLLLITAAAGFVIYKFVKGELSPVVAYSLAAVVAVAAVVFIAGKIKGI